MKAIITILFSLMALNVFGQMRQFTPAQIISIDAAFGANEGDLYHDNISGILYIGLMDGTLIPIQDTDDQTIDLSTHDA